MKKAFLFIFTSFQSFTVFAQKSSDTVFIKRYNKNTNDSFYDHSLFIIADRQSICYEHMASVKIKNEDKELYETAINEENNISKHKLEKHNMHGLPQNWRKVVYYKGVYYPYLHEDLGNEMYQVNDSVAVSFTMDGPYPKIIQSVKRKNKYVYQLILQYASETFDTTKIYIIDPINQIAVFENKRNNYPYQEYSLMINTEKVKKLPIIVSFSPTSRTHSFKGDTVDYEKLIEKYKN